MNRKNINNLLLISGIICLSIGIMLLLSRNILQQDILYSSNEPTEVIGNIFVFAYIGSLALLIGGVLIIIGGIILTIYIFRT